MDDFKGVYGQADRGFASQSGMQSVQNLETVINEGDRKSVV